MQLCLGDDETMVCPIVRAAFFLGHSHVPSPDHDIVNEVPVLEARGHPRRLVAGRETEHRVGYGQVMCGAGREQKEAVTVAISYSMVSDDSFPNLVVRLRNSGDEGFKFFIELFFDFICVGHGRSVGANKGSGTPPAKGELEFHKAIIQTFWDAVEFLDKMVFDGKAYTCLTSIVIAATTPEEGVSATNLGDLAFLRETGFA